DYWQDVATSFHDEDAHHLYVGPDTLRQALEQKAAVKLSSISQDQPHEFRAQGADTAARSLREAEPELEKLVRSGYRTVVAWVHETRRRTRSPCYEPKTVAAIAHNYRELEYRDGDRIFVPSDKLFKHPRYAGAGAPDPPLSKLGGKQWEQQKLRARRAAQALA